MTDDNKDWPDFFIPQDDYVPPKLHEYTCTECPSKDHCEFAFDDYNTNGDCLAMK